MDRAAGRKSWSDEKLITRALSAKTNKTHWDNVSELRQRASASLYARCLELVSSDHPIEHETGLHILSYFYQIKKSKRNKGGSYTVKFPYRKELYTLFWKMIAEETDKDCIASILIGIAHYSIRHTAKEIDLYLSFLSYEAEEIRFAVVMALSCIEDMKAIRGLIILSRDKISCIRDWATFSIGTQSNLDNDEIRKALYARCTDRHHDTRMEAISGLAKRKDEGVKPYLEKEFSACTVYVLNSIEELNAVEYLPRLESLLKETENDQDTNQYWFNCLKKCIESLRCGQQEFDVK
jgi:hypothetical protein